MIKHFLTGLTLILIVVGCSQTPAQTPRATSVIEDREWELTGFEKASMAIPKNATLLLIDGRYMGNSGCNSMGGQYQVDADRINFQAAYSTKMNCADIDLEMKILGLMFKVDQFRVEGGRLSLMHKGQVVMRFTEK